MYMPEAVAAQVPFSVMTAKTTNTQSDFLTVSVLFQHSTG